MIDLYNRSKQSVVHITTTVLRRDIYQNVTNVPEGTGSGFIWDDQGHVVTNYHVVRRRVLMSCLRMARPIPVI